MSPQFIKLEHVHLEGFGPEPSVADVLVNAEHVVAVLSEDHAETSIVVLTEGRTLYLSDQQLKRFEAALAGRTRDA